MIPPRLATDRRRTDRRRMNRGEGFASRVSGNVRPKDPGGGAMPIVAPRRMTNNDVSNTPELSGGGGGGLSWSPPEFRWCRSRRPMLGTLQDGSVHVKIKRSGHWLALEIRQVGLCLMTRLGRHAGGGGRCPLLLLPGGSFRWMLRMHQRCQLRGLCWFPPGFRWCWSMRPWWGTLQDGSVHVRIGICDRRLA